VSIVNDKHIYLAEIKKLYWENSKRINQNRISYMDILNSCYNIYEYISDKNLKCTHQSSYSSDWEYHRFGKYKKILSSNLSESYWICYKNFQYQYYQSIICVVWATASLLYVRMSLILFSYNTILTILTISFRNKKRINIYTYTHTIIS